MGLAASLLAQARALRGSISQRAAQLAALKNYVRQLRNSQPGHDLNVGTWSPFTSQSQQFYHRPIYKHILNYLCEKWARPGDDSSFILTGVSGNGKTVSPHFLMAKLLQIPDAEIILQTTDVDFYFISRQEIKVATYEEVKPFLSMYSENRYYLIDSCTPKNSCRLKTLLTTSPQAAIAKTWRVQFAAERLWLQDWDLGEILLGAAVAKGSSLTQEDIQRLQSRFDYFGGSARQVMFISDGLGKDIYTESVEEALAEDLSHGLLAMVQHNLSHSIAHRLFHYAVDENFQATRIHFASAKIKEMVLDAVSSAGAINIEVLARMSMDKQSMAALIATEIIQNIAWTHIMNHCPEARPLFQQGQPMQLPVVETMQHPWEPTNAVKSQKNVLVVPRRQNYEAADALLPPSVLFQVTINTRGHKIHGGGLVQSARFMSQRGDLSFVFLVPENRAHYYRKPQLITPVTPEFAKLCNRQLAVMQKELQALIPRVKQYICAFPVLSMSERVQAQEPLPQVQQAPFPSPQFEVPLAEGENCQDSRKRKQPTSTSKKPTSTSKKGKRKKMSP